MERYVFIDTLSEISDDTWSTIKVWRKQYGFSFDCHVCGSKEDVYDAIWRFAATFNKL